MRKGTAFADRKETEFASLGLRVVIAVESYKCGRRSMDHQLKEFRRSGRVLKQVYRELTQQIGLMLYGLNYFMKPNAEQQAAELLELLKQWEASNSKAEVIPFPNQIRKPASSEKPN
jgi:hypothetical protein